jgi:hypothetical protein
MTTAAPSTALATIQPAFTDPERLALAGYLAGYRGLTREPVRRPPCRHRILRPRPRGQRPGPRDGHPAAVHHRGLLQVRG